MTYSWDKIATINSKPGKGDSYVVPYLKSIEISELKYIVSSHHDGDHIGGLDEVLNYTEDSDDYKITLTGKAYQPAGLPKNSQKKQYNEYASAVAAQIGNGVETLNPPEMINLAKGLSIQVVTGGGAYIDKNTGSVIDLQTNEANARSIGLLLTFNKFKFFVGGDLGGQSQHKKIENKVAPYLGDIDVLRANHHGANTSTHIPFVNITKPEVVLISCGKNSYGHPRQKVIDRLRVGNNDVQIYQTEEGDLINKYSNLATTEGLISGNIIVKTDGDCRFTVTGNGSEFNETKTFTNDDCL